MKKGKIIRKKYDPEFKMDAVKLAEKIVILPQFYGHFS